MTAVDLTAEVPEILRAAIRYASQVRQTHSRELRAVDQIAHPEADAHAYADALTDLLLRAIRK